jgi:ABC-type bacteriocin/lantibiotic exporter with double-glycine peptidase domain
MPVGVASDVVESLGRLLYVFPSRERWSFSAAALLSFGAAAFETIGVAAILPFMTIILSRDALVGFPSIHKVTAAFGVSDPRSELILLGSGLALLFVFGNFVATFNAFVQERLAARSSARLAAQLFSGYLTQSIAFHTHRDSASLLKVLFEDINNMRLNVLVPILFGCARVFMTSLIITVLLIRDPVTGFSAAIAIGGAYALMFRAVREGLRRKGESYHRDNAARLQIAQEAFGGFRELKALGREQACAQQFSRLSLRAAQTDSISRVIAVLPRYLFETIAFGGVLLGTIWLVGHNREPAQVIPTIALYAFAGYKLLPAMQQLFSSAVQLRFSLPALRAVADDVHKIRQNPTPESLHSDLTGEEHHIEFNQAIEFENVSFRYTSGARASLTNISVSLKRMESVCLVGRSGAGKSTFADLLLGFYQPNTGKIHVDQVSLNASNISSWRRKIGYVPQEIFLSSASIAENIAFGLPLEAIDMAAVESAAALAQAEEFILGLPEQYATRVGERGAKLSGGQRQRIGIARALYHQPEVLILDEATNDLDGLTEEAVMEAIDALSKKVTFIVIAHRPRTIRACQRIIMLERGQIVADGSYDRLVNTSKPFSRMVLDGPGVTRSEYRVLATT